MTEPITPADLDQFYGSEQFYKHWLGIIYTDGIHYLAEKANAFWLIDLIASYQNDPKVKREPFQLWTLELNGQGGATAYAQSDSDEPRLAEQEIEYTDFPVTLGPKFEMYLEDGSLDGVTTVKVLMLKSER